MQSGTIVSLQNVSLEYKGSGGKVWAIQDINLDIDQGDFLCVLGPSGCGKSTLLSIIAGFFKPTTGTVLMEDSEINGPDWTRGVVFQTPPLYPWLNVYDNVAYGLKRRKISKAEIAQKVEEYLKFVDLQEFKGYMPYELSGGMRQRASMARVLVNQPKMVLMDEPLGALDALTKTNMQTLIRNIWRKEQNTIFYITHDVDEALMLATRIIIMSERPGHILRDISVGFTLLANGTDDEGIKYSSEYINLRREIMQIINPKVVAERKT